jgi:hypothetical protein
VALKTVAMAYPVQLGYALFRMGKGGGKCICHMSPNHDSNCGLHCAKCHASQQYPFDATLVCLCHIVLHPVGAQQMASHFDDDIVGLDFGICAEAGQTLQA